MNKRLRDCGTAGPREHMNKSLRPHPYWPPHPTIRKLDTPAITSYTPRMATFIEGIWEQDFVSVLNTRNGPVQLVRVRYMPDDKSAPFYECVVALNGVERVDSDEEDSQTYKVTGRVVVPDVEQQLQVSVFALPKDYVLDAGIVWQAAYQIARKALK